MRGRVINQTSIGTLRFSEVEERDMALVVALGKPALLWWAAIGDDFHVTTSVLGSVPIDVTKLPSYAKSELLKISRKLQVLMADNIVYTKYAGKWMGNYDIKFIRDMTDRADRIVLEAIGIYDAWDEIELAYARFMKVTGERPGTVRKLPEFDK
jgi:predicted transcriptional regulator